MTAAPDALRSISLASAIDFDGFRRACRDLWARQIAPDHVSWHTADDIEGDLFDGDDGIVKGIGDGDAIPRIHTAAGRRG